MTLYIGSGPHNFGKHGFSAVPNSNMPTQICPENNNNSYLVALLILEYTTVSDWNEFHLHTSYDKCTKA